MAAVRTLKVVAAFAVVCVAGAAQAQINNGSFETGDYTGWTLFEDSGEASLGTWGIAASGQTINPLELTFDFFDGLLVEQNSAGLPRTYAPTDGNFMAYQLQNAPETHRMYQDVALATNTTTLSWDMFYQDHGGVFDPVTQYLRVAIMDLSDNILSTLFLTSPGDPQSIPMSAFSGDISAFAGTTVRVDVTMQVQDFYFDAGFDDFRVVGAVPEPASLALLALGLAGLGFSRRKQ